MPSVGAGQEAGRAADVSNRLARTDQPGAPQPVAHAMRPNQSACCARRRAKVGARDLLGQIRRCARRSPVGGVTLSSGPAPKRGTRQTEASARLAIITQLRGDTWQELQVGAAAGHLLSRQCAAWPGVQWAPCWGRMHRRRSGQRGRGVGYPVKTARARRHLLTPPADLRAPRSECFSACDGGPQASQSAGQAFLD